MNKILTSLANLSERAFNRQMEPWQNVRGPIIFSTFKKGGMDLGVLSIRQMAKKLGGKMEGKSLLFEDLIHYSEFKEDQEDA